MVGKIFALLLAVMLSSSVFAVPQPTQTQSQQGEQTKQTMADYCKEHTC